MTVLFNGNFTTKPNISPLVSQHSQYGLGFFETILYMNDKIFFLQDHIERINRTCRDFKIDLNLSSLNESLIPKLLKKNKLINQTCRIKIIYAPMAKTNEWSTVITAMPYTPKAENFKLAIHDEIYESHLNRYKSLNYQYNLYWREFYQKQSGCDEVLFCNSRKNILEGSFTNILVKKGSKIFYADKKNPYLWGITQDRIIELVGKRGDLTSVSLTEGFSPEFLKDADGVYITNSLILIKEAKKVLLKDKVLFKKQVSSESFLQEIYNDLLNRGSI